MNSTTEPNIETYGNVDKLSLHIFYSLINIRLVELELLASLFFLFELLFEISYSFLEIEG